MTLTDNAIKAMTLEQVMHYVYDYDARVQSLALRTANDERVTFSVTFTIEVTPELARAALATFPGMKLTAPHTMLRNASQPKENK